MGVLSKCGAVLLTLERRVLPCSCLSFLGVPQQLVYPLGQVHQYSNRSSSGRQQQKRRQTDRHNIRQCRFHPMPFPKKTNQREEVTPAGWLTVVLADFGGVEEFASGAECSRFQVVCFSKTENKLFIQTKFRSSRRMTKYNCLSNALPAGGSKQMSGL